jgi:DNA-binding MarR family transcriptional regulator
VHQRVRLGILAECANAARVDFAYLKSTLQLTDGNLGRHLETLEQAGLVEIQRERGPARPRSWIKITRKGRSALQREVTALRALLRTIDEDDHAN